MQLTGVSAAISNINRKLDCCFHSVCSSFSALVDHITNLFYISAGLIQSWENGFILRSILVLYYGFKKYDGHRQIFFSRPISSRWWVGRGSNVITATQSMTLVDLKWSPPTSVVSWPWWYIEYISRKNEICLGALFKISKKIVLFYCIFYHDISNKPKTIIWN